MQRAINTRKSPRGAEIRKAEPQQVESSALVVNFLWEFFMTEVRTGGSGRGDGSTVRGVDRRECTGDIKYSVAPLPFIGPRSLHLLRRLKFLLRIFFFFFSPNTPSHVPRRYMFYMAVARLAKRMATRGLKRPLSERICL